MNRKVYGAVACAYINDDIRVSKTRFYRLSEPKDNNSTSVLLSPIAEFPLTTELNLFVFFRINYRSKNRHKVQMEGMVYTIPVIVEQILGNKWTV